jgi:hypothetical protein
MPTYEITAPDGNVYEVTAPEGASEQDVLSYAQQNYAPEQKVESKSIPEPAPSKMKSFGEGVFDMATFGLGDELTAKGASVVSGVPYEDLLNEARTVQDQAKLNQKSYIGGQVVGALMPYGGAVKGGMSIARGAGTGAVQGALYGAGSGEGGAEERLQSAAMGGAFGAGGGAGGVLAGRQLSKLGQTAPVKSMAERAKSLFFKPVKPVVNQQAIQIPSGGERQLKTLSKGGDDVFSMTKGQKTQLPKPQRLEADALAGIYGDDAERAVRLAQTAQSRERQSFIKQLGDIDKIGDANDVLDNVFDTIKSQSKSLKGQVDNAYSLAREGGGTKISVDDIKDGLFTQVANLKREGQYDLKMLPQANARAKELAKLVRKSEGGRFTSANLSTMENWRKRVTNSVASTQDKTEKKFLRGVLDTYDDFMYKTANEAVDAQDEAAILTFRDAVSKRREYGKLYESDKFVNDIVTGKKGIDDAVKDLIGTGSIVGKKRMESTYDALVKAAGNDAPMVKADLQTAFAKKLLDQSISGLETGGENAYLSAAKTKKALEGLFINNRKFAAKLYGEQAVKVANQAIDELGRIATTQAATQNPSGSGQLVMRQLMRLPMLSTLKEGVNFTVIKPMKAGDVAKAVDPVVGQIRNIQIKPQSKMFSAAGGKLMAEQGVNK